MPYAFVEDVAASWEQYEQIAGTLIEPAPVGLVLHVAGPTDEGFRIIAVWESEDAWQQFRRDRLLPAIAALDGPPRPELLRAGIALAFIVAALLPSSAGALSGTQPLAVVLCKFTDLTNEPHQPPYYEAMFSEAGAGQRGVFDYWRDVSYGNLDLTGTVVKGWYTVPKTVAEWNALTGSAGRAQRINLCATQADPDIDFSKFAGVVVLTNQTNLQEDLFGAPPPTTVNNNQYANLGSMDAEEDQQLAGILHETGHSLGLNHSRKLSTSTQDYHDKYDIMSCLDCYRTSSYQGLGGPGMNAVQLQTVGWLPDSRDGSWNNCSNGTFTMAALNHPEVSGNQAMRINDVQTISTPPPAAGQPPGSTTSDYLDVELRSKSGWDAGIPGDAFVLYLHGQDNYSYWIDTADGPGGDGALGVPGDWYVDAARNVYVAVNAITPASYTGQVTLSTCKIDTEVTYTGATEGDYSDPVTLSGRLEVSGSLAPVPRKLITLSVGNQSCEGTTDTNGAASCTITLTQTPGSFTAGASYGGGPAFEAASASAGFTIDREDTTLTYGGALTSKYHDAFTASATLADADSSVGVPGAAVDFTLGSGDTCGGLTDLAGAVSCSITPQQPAGFVNVVSSYTGDSYYKPSSDSDVFEITKHETTTVYTGGTVIQQGQPVSRSAQLLEHPGVPIAGRTLTLNLAGQTCTTVPTDANGNASCSIASVAAPALGPQQVTADFAGDAYYLPSSETKDVIVFAFPSRGAFVLGDRTVAAATPSTTVTWWSDVWSSRNSLSGGPVGSSFKGFAGVPSTNPPACGATWTTSPGNSPPPVGGVPSYMGTLVSSRITKSGSTYAGNIVKIVVVRTNPGYAPDPNHPGTGTIVAAYCP